MKDIYVIYCNAVGEFYESSLESDPEGDVFTTPDINSAHTFSDCGEAQDFCDNNLADAVVLKWM